MLKTVKRIHQSTEHKVVQKGLHPSGHYSELETTMPSLFNIDPYPEHEKPPKIDLDLYQLEDFE